jgi:hypothetical protein
VTTPAVTTDPAEAHLGYLRACLEAATADPAAFDLPVMLAGWERALTALEVPLRLHRPAPDGQGHTICDRCGDTRWPCYEYEQIAKALLGKAAR